MKLIFLPGNKRQRFLQSYTTILCVCGARHAQIGQNNKIAISLQYLQQEVSDKVDFLQIGIIIGDTIIIAQGDTIIDEHAQSTQSYKFAIPF